MQMGPSCRQIPQDWKPNGKDHVFFRPRETSKTTSDKARGYFYFPFNRMNSGPSSRLLNPKEFLFFHCCTVPEEEGGSHPFRLISLVAPQFGSISEIAT